ncbi:hypothetical protein CS0771_23160 [Catellatospora sp. IY07-71]|uniref:DUF3515 family protein n=1 Tax=Catellatospora sp. IY07-71 TaxID=2728827 RepID=UPI001BB31233|nr:DUF3515 family protein [Catellatospora sp. IY07-71]BCJ72772.1 hypothetical protein CS0771_23160 [Catellatospora sp. IY07-71]
MSNDQTARSGDRSAKTIATAIAVPLALAAGFGFFQAMRPPAEPAPAPSASAAPRVMPTAPVAVPAPTLNARQTTVCRALLSQLPDRLQDLPRRDVTAGHEQNAAYGDPAVTVACGAAPVPSLAPEVKVWTLNGVCWHQSDEVWTTVDREVPVRVTMPLAYQPPGQWIIGLSNTLVATVPSAATIPAGCATRG